MNWKKIIFLLIILLSFLGTGAILSNVQSREADQMLEGHGMSNNTRYFVTHKKQTVQKFLAYLIKKYPHDKIQLHLDNRQNKNEVLVWANHPTLNLPTQTGHYFQSDDFKGQITFAVIGPNVKENLVERQNNLYLYSQNRYFSVIGQLKDYHQSEQTKYYLSTGINQPTAKKTLKYFRIVIDCSNHRHLQSIAKHYGGKLHVPAFVKNHQIYRFSVIREMLLIMLLWLIAGGANALLALLNMRQVRLTHLRGNLLRNWIINRSLRLFLIESLLAILAAIILHMRMFFNKPDHLWLLLAGNWLFILIAYVIGIIVFNRREQRKND